MKNGEYSIFFYPNLAFRLRQPEDILKQYFGYDNFRPLQREIVLSILEKKDTLALLPTGGGKSVCFQVPALMQDGVCVVVTPLVALMKDQVENLKKRDIQALALFGGMSRKEMEFELENCINGKYKFLYVSPERLLSKHFLGYAVNIKVSFIAVDEAHCISQWGYDFRPPYLKIAEFREKVGKPPVMALTASATPAVVQDIAKKLELKNHQLFKKSFTRDNLSYIVEHTENKWERMKTLFSKVKGTGLVYVKSRRRTVEIAEFLCKNGIKADYYHAGLDAQLRTNKQDDWKMGRTPVIVCTNAFGMGIDKPDVRLVVHEQKPDTPEAYYQEAGRAGRDGNRSYCVLLWHESDFLDDQRQIDSKYPLPKEIERIYELICNYLRVAVGSGEGQSFNFDITEFCNYYKLNPGLVFNCIRILESEAYLQSSDALYLPSRLKFVVNYEALYEWQLKHESVNELSKLILRSYGGVFDFYTNIYENELARRLKKPEKWVKEQLKKMHDVDLIDYIPQNNKPQIIFLENRFPKVHISSEKIEFLRARYKEMLKAMNDFVKNKKDCRSKVLVAYFGETDATDCGKCDVCLEKKKLLDPANKDKVKLEKLMSMFDDGLLTIEKLQKTLEPSELDGYLILLRWLIDEGRVKETEGKWLWVGRKS